MKFPIFKVCASMDCPVANKGEIHCFREVKVVGSKSSRIKVFQQGSQFWQILVYVGISIQACPKFILEYFSSRKFV